MAMEKMIGCNGGFPRNQRMIELTTGLYPTTERMVVGFLPNIERLLGKPDN
jgi:hypothetical protein